jgi:aminotransferase
MSPVTEKSLLQPPDIANRRPRFRSERTHRFTESVIREMTRLSEKHGGVNLSQGFPDFAAPAAVKEAACGVDF